MFWSQLVASIFSVIASLVVTNWQIDNIPGLCDPLNKDKFTCPGYTTFFSSAIQWGVIGPGRLYSLGHIYGSLTVGFLVGAILPVPVYFLSKRYPRSWICHFHVPVFISGGLTFSPFNLSYLTSAIPFAVIFQHYLHKRAPDWWAKYTYIIASALTASVSMFGILYFFAIQFPNVEPNWIGNSIPFSGCDGTGCPLLPIPAKGFFGPSVFT